jgi:peroxiredoxin
LIRAQIPKDSLTILAVNASSSSAELQNYAGQRGITYSLVYDGKGVLYKDYEVGAAYGNTPPTFIIIDRQAIIRYRIDDQFNKALEMKDTIRQWLKEGT